MAFALAVSAISIGLRRQRVRARALRDFLAKAFTIVIEQRMAAARGEIERGRERLWLRKPGEQN